jgi:hypothetical protein
MKVRRVITGHDGSGKAVVKIDETVKDLKIGRPGAMVAPIWITEGFPVDNDGSDDTSKRQVGTTLPGGTVLRVVEFSPGVLAQPSNQFNRLRHCHVRRDRHGDGWHAHPSQGR